MFLLGYRRVVLFVALVAGVFGLEAWQLLAVFTRLPSPLGPRLACGLHFAAGAGLLCILYGRFIEPYRLEVTRHELRTSKLRHVRFRIVQIADIQCDRRSVNAEALPEVVNSLNADVIVFTGDAINEPAGLGVFRSTLGALEARLGKFAVRGNIEERRFPELDLSDGTGFTHLPSGTAVLEKGGERLCVAGADWGRAGELDAVLKQAPEDAPCVLLHHTPDLIEAVAGSRVDLYLAGHTHGGQVRLPLYGALVTLSAFDKRYEAGSFDVRGTVLYVSRGVGLEGSYAPRVRFLCRPEVAVFDIVPEEGQAPVRTF